MKPYVVFVCVGGSGSSAAEARAMGRLQVVRVEGGYGARDDDEEKEMQRKLEEDWKAAKLFMAKGPSATLQYLKEEPKALLYALDAQALDGSCPADVDAAMAAMDPSFRKKQEAWKSLRGMPILEAKRRFVDLLSSVLPEWKDWRALQMSEQQAQDQELDEVSRILARFSQRTGLIIKSML